MPRGIAGMPLDAEDITCGMDSQHDEPAGERACEDAVLTHPRCKKLTATAAERRLGGWDYFRRTFCARNVLSISRRYPNDLGPADLTSRTTKRLIPRRPVYVEKPFSDSSNGPGEAGRFGDGLIRRGFCRRRSAGAANENHGSAACIARITSPTRQQGGGAFLRGSMLKSLANAIRSCAIRA